MKFKIGDTVKVVNPIEDLDSDFKKGHRGTVINYKRGEPYPYEVERKNGNRQWFNVKELKLIKQKRRQ